MTNSSLPKYRRRRAVAALLATLALVLAACGGDPAPISVPVSGESAAAPTNQEPAVPVGVASSDLGQILVNDAGFSLYGFTDDIDGVSACYDGCAGAWPPILVPSAELPDGLDPAIFSVTQRTDGTNQLKAGKWPLYLFAGDTAAGQTSGHLSGDVWFLAAPDGSLIGVADGEPVAGEQSAEPVSPVVATATSSLGDILVNSAGLTLYGFINDADGLPTCEGGCADAWPPILLATAELPAGLDASVFSIVARPDGSNQLKAGKWPLYLFAGDTTPGQTTGHLSGDVWFAVSPSGALIDAPSAEPEAFEVATSTSEFGDILVDDLGLALYGFLNDADGVPTCDGACADAWPPVILPTNELPSALDPAVFSVAERSDGTYQLKAGKWPLYRFAGDVAPGQTSGHLSGDVWFLASPTGALIGAAAVQQPAPTPPPATPVPAPPATPVPAPPTPDPYGSDY